jgi:hypothetical protein
MKSSTKLRYFFSNLVIFSLLIILCHGKANNKNLNILQEEEVYTIEEQKGIFNLSFIESNFSKYIN